MTPVRANSAHDRNATQPLVSIIIATYNRGPFLERCVRSVLDQTYRNVECVVVDGASKDESVQILKRLAASDPRLKCVSEPDQGEVYAVNKGIEMAAGEIIGFQASDDFYLPDAVEKSVEFLLREPEYIGVSADALYIDEKGRELGNGVVTYRGRMARETVKRLIVVRYKMCPVCHGSFFGWKKRLSQHGKFNPEFSVIMDWEFYLRILKAGEQIGSLPRVHYKYTAHADMGAVKYWAKVEAQRERLYQIHAITKVDILLRATIGRLMSYLANPYRTPLGKGLVREFKLWRSQRAS
ncbi:MAG: glycosyltransferase [Verrucomicrobia bacterium]|nr:glycosyltransferase [Verrucomicrobiota bacterium]